MPFDPNKREYRNFHDIGADPMEENKDSMIVRGYASVFDFEYPLWETEEGIFTEQVCRGAFDQTDLRDVIMQYNHEGRVFCRTRNNTLEVGGDDTGLAMRADLHGTTIGRQLYEEIRGGYTDKMSFGFVVGEGNAEWDTSSIDAETGKRLYRRYIKRIKKVYDVSAVSLPASEATSISVRSLCDGVIEEYRRELAQIAQIETERQRAIMRARLLKNL